MPADSGSTSIPGDDLRLSVAVNGSFGSVGTVSAPPGSSLGILMASPNGGLLGGIPIVAATLYPNVVPPAPNPGLPFIHINLASFVLLVDGTAPVPFGVGALSASGVGLGLSVPPGLAGTTLRLQGAAFFPAALNSQYGTTEAHDVVF